MKVMKVMKVIKKTGRYIAEDEAVQKDPFLDKWRLSEEMLEDYLEEIEDLWNAGRRAAEEIGMESALTAPQAKIPEAPDVSVSVPEAPAREREWERGGESERPVCEARRTSGRAWRRPKKIRRVPCRRPAAERDEDRDKDKAPASVHAE